MYSAKVLIPVPEFTTNMFGKLTPIVIGARSLNGSYGNFIMCGAIVSGPTDPNKIVLPSVGPVAAN